MTRPANDESPLEGPSLNRPNPLDIRGLMGLRKTEPVLHSGQKVRRFIKRTLIKPRRKQFHKGDRVLLQRAMLIVAVATVVMSGGQFARAGTEAVSPDKLPVKGLVNLVDLGAGQCIPCRMMAPILSDLAKKYRGKAVVAFIDIRFHRQAVRRFGIRIIPTQIFYDRNGREVFRHEGYMNKAAIEHVFKRLGLK